MHPTVHQFALIEKGLWVAEFLFSAILLAAVYLRKRPLFFWLKCFVWLKFTAFLVLFPIVQWRPFGHTLLQQYTFYFFPYWTFYAVEALISFFVIRELFLISLEPLEGLRRLGLILFAWVATISAVVALSVSIGPSHSGILFATQVVSEFQRCQSVLQLSLLLFLVLIARPLGVEINNRIFGASMGFSVLAVSDLVSTGWFHNQSMLSKVNLFHSAALPIALCVWITYAFLPEPKRVPVSLPVTSALLRWNEVAKSLGKSGGRVVVVGNRELLDHDLEAWDRAVEVVRTKQQLSA